MKIALNFGNKSSLWLLKRLKKKKIEKEELVRRQVSFQCLMFFILAVLGPFLP